MNSVRVFKKEEGKGESVFKGMPCITFSTELICWYDMNSTANSAITAGSPLPLLGTFGLCCCRRGNLKAGKSLCLVGQAKVRLLESLRTQTIVSSFVNSFYIWAWFINRIMIQIYWIAEVRVYV